MSNRALCLKIAVLLMIFMVFPTLTGCNHPMALNPGTTSLNTRTQSVAFFTLVVKNDYKPSFGVAPVHLQVKSSQSGTTQFHLEGDWQGNGTNFLIPWTGVSE